MRELVGVIFRDLPRYFSALAGDRRAYLAVRNRNERLTRASGQDGYRCEWQWTSDLHAPKVLPALGRVLVQRALSDHPIKLVVAPRAAADRPDVSFVIGHRGRERIPLLQATLESIAGQMGVSVEVVIVEQSQSRVLHGTLPSWVRYVHTPVDDGTPYNRSWAFNVGARIARGATLVLHDNDMLVPTDYAACALDLVIRGSEVANLKRFVFYLDSGATDTVLRDRKVAVVAPERVVQNLNGGGSLVIKAETYDRLGGMDEGFVGWGGEDNEFWERCALARRWEYGYLSMVHLWHPAQPGKADVENPTLARCRCLATLNPAERARRLAQAPRGESNPRKVDPFADLMERV